jgi:uncharacterized protein (TIGR02117 family)
MSFPPIIHKIWRTTGWIVLSLILFVYAYIGLAYMLSRITYAEEPDEPRTYELFLLSNGVHTDIVVPAKTDLIDWTSLVPYTHTKGKNSTLTHLGMGWGDKGFYLETPTWADLKFSVAFKAATGLSTTAIHATYLRRPTINDSCSRVMVSKQQYQRIIDYILQSLQKKADGKPILIPTNAVYGNDDAFYEAYGSYSMLHTCNTWVNNALKKSGLRHCLWTPFDTGLLQLYADK